MDQNNTGSDSAGGDAFLERRIIDIVIEMTNTPREKIAPDTRLFDITDSLGVMEVVMALEDEFEGSIPDEAAATIQTVGQLVEHVRTHLAVSRSGP